MTLPKDLTPNLLKDLDAQLAVFCPECRVTRGVDLLALIVAGRGNQPIRAMAWKCGKCQGPGDASAVWWDGERRAYEFNTGQLKSGGLPNVY